MPTTVNRPEADWWVGGLLVTGYWLLATDHPYILTRSLLGS